MTLPPGFNTGGVQEGIEAMRGEFDYRNRSSPGALSQWRTYIWWKG